MASAIEEWRFDFLDDDDKQILQSYLTSMRKSQATSDVQQPLLLSEAASFIDWLWETSPPTHIKQQAARSFETSFLDNRKRDIHATVLALDVNQRLPLIQAYTRLASATKTPAARTRSLLRAVSDDGAKLLAVFGGQGTQNPQCLDDMRSLYRVYGPYIETMLHNAADTLRRVSTTAHYFSPAGFDLLHWLSCPEDAPSPELAASAAISFPLNGLASLCHYCISCHILGLDPLQMRGYLSGATGHSQGIIIAAVVAGSDSWESFYSLASDAIALLFWIGFKSQPQQHSVISGYADRMLSIRGLTRDALASILEKVNTHFNVQDQVVLALVNSSKSLVVSGKHRALRGVQNLLDDMKASSNSNESRVPYPDRDPVIEYTFLPISAPFHSPALSAVKDEVFAAAFTDTSFGTLCLGIPVYDTCTGRNIQFTSGWLLVKALISMILTEPVDWPKACVHKDISHIVDFGPGRTSSLVQDQIDGSGKRIIFAAEVIESTDFHGGKHELFSQEPYQAPEDWSILYGPSLVDMPGRGPKIANRFTQLLGTPPLMVAGMTPTTSSWAFVWSIMNAGYHTELAAGGFPVPEMMEAAIRQLAASIPPHRGIAINVIYASPQTMLWQTQLIARLISEGLPIDGLTIGAGVPSPDAAAEFIETLGLKYIAFKPGSISSIEAVLAIAKRFPDFPIVLQWTGGRAGGHHSYEDQFEPMLATYSHIRKCANITLVIGGGLGDTQSALPFFTGEWSESFGYARMPFDGVMIGSRVMTAFEAKTSTKVKELIAATPGTSDGDWPKTYKGPAGGIVTVMSEMGEPIYLVANRAALLWKELDDTIFCIKNEEERTRKLLQRRSEIINRLNQDSCRPWFAMTQGGKAVEIEDLSYIECLRRCVDLMYLKERGRWVHESYQRFFSSFLEHTLETLSITPEVGSNPVDILANLARREPEALNELLDPEDVEHFMFLCRRGGKKPLNFIPKLAGNFETCYKKDSLWQAEDLDATYGADAQRVCIIHGPVAARYTNKINEPVAEILDSIISGVTMCLHQQQNDNDAISDERTECLSVKPIMLSDVKILDFDPSYSSNTELLLQKISPEAPAWLRFCLTGQFILRNHARVSNPIPIAFNFGPGDSLHVEYNADSTPSSIALLRPDPHGAHPFVGLKLKSSDGQQVKVSVGIPDSLSKQVNLALHLDFSLVGPPGSCILHDVTPDRDDRVRELYSACWAGNSNDCGSRGSLLDREFHGEVTLTQKMLAEFVGVLSKASPDVEGRPHTAPQVPIDISIVIAWPTLTQTLLTPELGGDLSRLLHRSNSFRVCDDARPLAIGDVLTTKAHITSVEIQSSGKVVEVAVAICRDGSRVIVLESSFFIPGKFLDEASISIEESSLHMKIDSPQLDALLRSRKWFKLREPSLALWGKDLDFQLTSRRCQLPGCESYELLVTGKALYGSEHLADIQFSSPTCTGNPVVDFLQRRCAQASSKIPLEKPGWSSSDPLSLKIADIGFEYSLVSGDTNPIHTCAPFAAFAGLDGPIIHGMYTSAMCRQAVEQHVAASSSSGVFRRWWTSFEDKVHGGDELRIEVQHTAMAEGRMHLEIQAYRGDTGARVLRAEAEVEQAAAAYIFCGQGSQEKGMGMSTYESDEVARNVWDRGDRHLRELYGVSLLEIVRTNPTSLTVHFNGARGRRILQNYLSLTMEVNGATVPVLQDLKPRSKSYTFSNPSGLLFSTQFAQPAISLMNLAETAALESRGLIPDNVLFAGHSLGEYSSLSGCGGVFSVEDLMTLTFYRGTIMQNWVDQDTSGKTGFSMSAVDPSRVTKGFSEAALVKLVQDISSATGLLLEVVNYNIEGRQYVCAGHLKSLWVLGQVCDWVAAGKPGDTSSLITEAIDASSVLPGPIRLQRGRATVPLAGVNVPFHSSALRPGIDTYRQYLAQKIKQRNINPEKLIGRYIPNLTGKPFSLSRDYIQEVADMTGSEPLQQLLEAWS